MTEICHRCTEPAPKFFEMIDGGVHPICATHACYVMPEHLAELAPIGDCRTCGAKDVALTGKVRIISSRRDPYEEGLCEECRIFGEEDRLKAIALREKYKISDRNSKIMAACLVSFFVIWFVVLMIIK